MHPVADHRRDIRIDSYLERRSDERTLADDVLDGLTRPFKELPPKHLYDARGSELFDRICELPEYYPTRTERAILEAAAPTRSSRRPARPSWSSSARARRPRRGCCSTRWRDAGTLRALRAGRRLRGRWCATCAEALVDEYPGLRVHGVVGDFERHLLRRPRGRRPADRRLPGRHDRQLPARAAGAGSCARSRRCCGPATTICCSAPTWSRTRRCSRPPTTTAPA